MALPSDRSFTDSFENAGRTGFYECYEPIAMVMTFRSFFSSGRAVRRWLSEWWQA
jgi:hypothetical protein